MDSNWALRFRLRPFMANRQIDQIIATHGVNISYVNMHDDCAAIPALTNLLAMNEWAQPGIDQPSDLVLFVGPCEAGTTVTAMMTSMYQVTHMHHGTDDMLSNKDTYPFANRVIETSSARMTSLGSFLADVGWNLVSMLVQDTLQSTDRANIFKSTTAPRYEIELSLELQVYIDNADVVRTSSPEYVEAVQQLADPSFHDARVVLVMIDGFMTQDVEFCSENSLLPFEPMLITVWAYSSGNIMPPFGAYYVVDVAAADSVWDALCEPMYADYYNWYKRILTPGALL